MAHSTVMSSKGQLVIPIKLREELGLKPGVRVFFEKQGKGLRIEADAQRTLDALCGKYAGSRLEEMVAEERRKWESRLEAL